jgi:hypothetical protein
MLPHFLDNHLTGGGEYLSLMRWPPFTPRNITRHTDAAPCAQPAHRAQRKDYAGSHIPRRWFRGRQHFSGQYNSHSIITYSTTDLDHPDYTLLSAHHFPVQFALKLSFS